METKKCKHCGDNFNGNKRKIFCSDACRIRSHEKNNAKKAKAFIEDRNPPVDVLEQKYPGVPKQLLKLAHNISLLRTLIEDPNHPFTEGALKAVTQTHNRRVEIMEIKLEIHRRGTLRGIGMKERLKGYEELNDRLIELEAVDAVCVTKGHQKAAELGITLPSWTKR